MPLRPLEKQFEPKKVTEINSIKKEYGDLRLALRGDSSGYMISGITRCLETGILLGALSLAFSFLDMFVHDLVIMEAKRREEDNGPIEGRDPLPSTERNRLPVERHILTLTRDGFIEEKDGKEILLIHRNIGTPLHHLLSRDIGRYSKPLILGGDNLLDRFLSRNIGDLHQVEEMIEDYSTECLKRIVSFIAKYQEVYEL
jgi:hypothetical protein